jgi:hypothetical protein
MSDLGDFGGGIEYEDPEDPEDRDNLYLSKWLSSPEVDVYWDREKAYGFSPFSSGLARIPDLVVDAKVNTFALEVKPPDASGQVIDAGPQAKQYWVDIESGEAQYRLDGEPTEIDAILVATRASPDGHLFENKRGRDPRRPSRSRGASDVVEHGHLPTVEHTASEVFVRSMHRMAREWYRNSEKEETETGIGGLYSSSLDDGPSGKASVPAAFHLRPGAGRQAHAWDYIPFYKQK